MSQEEARIATWARKVYKTIKRPSAILQRYLQCITSFGNGKTIHSIHTSAHCEDWELEVWQAPQFERRARSSCCALVLFLAEFQMAKQNAILFTKSARLYTKLRVLSSTLPIKYPKT